MTTRSELPTAYVYCRALLHAWDEIPYDGNAPTHWRSNLRSVSIVQLRCTRCGTQRYDIWSNITGEVIERKYATPEGYSLPKGEGRKVLIRREYLSRRDSNGRRRKSA
jgi:hypothetical protein